MVGTEVARLMNDVQNRPLEVCFRDSFAHRDLPQIDQLLRESEREIGSPAAFWESCAQSDRGVRQQPRLNHIGAGRADILKQRLKSRIVEQTDRNGLIHCQTVAQKLTDALGDQGLRVRIIDIGRSGMFTNLWGGAGQVRTGIDRHAPPDHDAPEG